MKYALVFIAAYIIGHVIHFTFGFLELGIKKLFKPKRRFYIKQDGKYLIQLSCYEWFANRPVWTRNILDAGEYTDYMYSNIKSQLPENHTLELVY